MEKSWLGVEGSGGGLSLDVEGDKTPTLMFCPICEVCPVSHSLGQALCLNETNLNK